MPGVADWKMSVPQGWSVWVPGSPDVAALRAAATTTRRAGVSLTHGIGVIEKELEKAPGDVLQAGVRAADPRTGLVSGSMRLTHWPRPAVDGRPLNAKRHLEQLREQGPAPGRQYQHREVTLTTVPAGQCVLVSEIWRKNWGLRSMTALTATIFPRGTSSLFRLEVTSRYGELQPELMAETSLMAHSLEVRAADVAGEVAPGGATT